MLLREYLEKNKLMTDGSFGTYYARLYDTQEMPEFANESAPERVIAIHRAYIEAGAKLLRTNTFASNTILLHQDFNAVARNLTVAVENARTAIHQISSELSSISVCKTAGAPAASLPSPNHASDSYSDSHLIYIAGDIGPIPGSGFGDADERRLMEEEYYQIARVLVDSGLDVLVFETFPELECILPAIRRIKMEEAAKGHDLFIITQFAINQFGYSTSGFSARRLLEGAAKVDEIDAIGLNCGVGPAHMCQLLERLSLTTDKFLTALPNAGYPKLDRKQIQFGNSSSYFAMKMQDLADLGVDILGGCCGTDPDYMKKLHETLELTQKARPIPSEAAAAARPLAKKKGFLYDENGKRKTGKLIAVELAPPFDANDERLLESAHILQQAHVDVLTFPDSPSGRTRVDSVLMAGKVHQETGLPVMPHICCRDKNAVAIRSLLLGAQINDIHNMLVITGDPLPSMVRQTIKAVFNFDAVGLMSIIKEMNEDTFAQLPMCYGGAINQGRRNLDVEIRRVHKKMEAGAKFFLTQPVFSQEDIIRLRRIKEETGATILLGIMPFVSRKNALFMSNEISGVNVPEELIDRYPEKATRAEGEAVGIAIANEMIAATADFADGYYFTFPFNRIHMLKDIVIP